MQFESFMGAESALLWGTFVIALIMGAVVNKTNFCTMGAVSDMVNIGDMSRMRAWFLAMAVAMLGVTFFEAVGAIDLNGSFPPYRSSQLIWAENLLGGLIFGIGMTLASGCGNKTLIRIGGGNIKSIIVLAVIGVVAYFMTNPFPGSDQTLFSVLFYDWIRPLAIDLNSQQDIGSLISSDNGDSVRMYAGIVIALLMMLFIFRSADFRGSFDNILGGVVVGLAVLGAWYLSSTIMITVPDEDPMTLNGYYQEWDMVAESDEGKPSAGGPLSAQSFTFVNPMGQTAGYTASGFERSQLTFGIMALLGVIAGSFLWSLISKSFRIEWFNSVSDFVNHFIGAILMGLGGVLGLGCTIGQGITGISTLAVGSFLTFAGIVFGSTLTMKINYYKLVYEEEATFMKALVASLADMKVLPNSLRKLDAV
ncbi:MAG TPA: YeeE/YedE family protein [Ectothiorhodospiraceae bacterium]|nr:YeeE/YedE family protein [Ectothiorhodospiraceae bacterium]